MIQGMLYGKPLIINVEMMMDSTAEEIEMNEWVDNIERFKMHRDNNKRYHYHRQSFFTKIYIKYGDSTLLYDLIDYKIIKNNGILDIDTIDVDLGKTKIEMYSDDSIQNAYRVSIKNVHINIKRYYNKQLRNTIDIEGAGCIRNMYGMLVTPMNTEMCRINNITDKMFLEKKNTLFSKKGIIEYFQKIDKDHKQITEKKIIPCY